MAQLLGFILVGLYVSTAGAVDLQSVRTEIKKSKATWTAGNNPISLMPIEEQKRLLGAPSPSQEKQPLEWPFPFPFPFPFPSEDTQNLPKSHSWRNQSGTNYASPILDQGRCGSCVAFAVVGALETQLNISRKTPYSPWELSAQHLFSCGGGFCERGWRPDSALQYLQDKGTPDESCFAYQSGIRGDDIACSKTCKDSDGRSLKISGYKTEAFLFSSQGSLKQALLKGPLVTTLQVYEDFPYYKSGIYKHVTGKATPCRSVAYLLLEKHKGLTTPSMC